MATIDSVREGSAAVVTLNNPEAFNALAPNMTDDLVDALTEAARDRTCRSVVLTGSGPKAFCAGIDVKSVAARDASSGEQQLDPVAAGFESLHHHLSSSIRAIHRLPIPVIAAVNGHAIGAGFALAAASDLRVAGSNARFADGFVKRGISGCELGLSYFLPKLVGGAMAFDWMMTGRNVDAVEAERTGFVSSVGEVDTTVDRALEVAARIEALAPLAVTMTKEVMWTNANATGLDQALALEARTQALARTTADAAEARQSFLEKRAPKFGASDVPRRLI